MDLGEAEGLARKLIAGWLHPVWSFRWNRSQTVHGECNVFDADGNGLYVISLSRALTAANPREVVEDTVLHEIAHALTNNVVEESHGPKWQENARRVGAVPVACAMDTGMAVMRAPYKWTATCPACGKDVGRRRWHPDMDGGFACASCCRERNGGEFDKRFVLKFTKNW